MFTRIIKLQKGLWWFGLALLILSFLLHVMLGGHNRSPISASGDYFILNFCITAVYALALFFSRKYIHRADKQAHRIILYALLLVSAWALNQEMPVFELSVLWMSLVQVVVITVLIVLCFFRYLPPVINHISMVLLGTGSLLFLYMSIYLFPLYVFGVLLSPALGISLHCFAPLFVTITIVVLFNKMCGYRKAYRFSFLGGLAAALTVTIIFCIQWTGAVRIINKAYGQTMVNNKPDLPGWVQLSQQVAQNPMTEKALKLDLVYTQLSDNMDDWAFNLPSARFNELKKHDPLIALAALFNKPIIGNEERIRILESTFSNRYATEERLWSGDHLTTENIVTTIQVWPEWQMAYTEKTIAVRNNYDGPFGGQEEGIYLFTLPEGSVVSALSLWVNGIEEKGILTTKQKATEAYNTIVGKEKRDPSVVHWQEGNQVSVRVFPVMPNDHRVFKIGVTTPLRKHDGEAIYDNIFFTGPSAADATETLQLRVSGKPESLRLPSFVKPVNGEVYTFEGKYKPDWSFRYKSCDLSGHNFIYKGKAYGVRNYQPQLIPYNIQQVYLDINSEWHQQEVDDILRLFQHKDVLVYENGWIKVTSQNAVEVYERLSKQSFSLFPVYAVNDTEKAILITKGNTAAPNLKDLHDTPFDTKTRDYLKTGKQLNILDLGKATSPYFKTLVEYRAVNYEKCDWSLLKQIAADHAFPANQETADQVVLKDAGVIITRKDSVGTDNAPDHLYRLFAYNNIMRQVGKYRNDTLHHQQGLVAEAEQAYVVTPVSSLIVLETQADYERFNIKDSKDNLQNAAHNTSGAVPEPHEWALIIVGVIALWYLKNNRKEKAVLWLRK